MMEHLFDCVICQFPVIDYTFRNGRERHNPPICRGCERLFSDTAPIAGAFTDRRVACMISALANALHSKATCMDWERRYGRA